MTERLPPWKRLRIGPGDEPDPFSWDSDPIDGTGRSFQRFEPPIPHDPIASRNDFTSLFAAIVARDVRTKPSYTDCWLTSQSNDVKVVSRYSTQFASVTVGLAEDGQTEYTVVPVEYSFPDSANVIVSDVIEDTLVVPHPRREAGQGLGHGRRPRRADRQVRRHQGGLRGFRRAGEAGGRHVLGLLQAFGRGRDL